MAIRILKNIVSRLRGNTDNTSKVNSTGSHGSKRKTRPASSLKKEEPKSVETWRPGQESTSETSDKSTNLSASRPTRRKRSRRKNEDGTVEIFNTSNAGCPLSEGKNPVLTVDVWEHAYYVDKRNARPAYVADFWNLVNWDFVNENYSA